MGKRVDVTDEELRKLRADGLSDYKIAKVLGCSPTTISNRIGKRSVAEVKPEVKPEVKVAEPKSDKKKCGRRLSVTSEELLAMRKSGMTDSAIAEKVGCSANTVARRIGKRPAEEVKADRKKLLEKASKSRRKVSDADMLALRAQGKSNQEVANILNVAPWTVYRHIGAERVSRNLAGQTKSKPTSREETPSTAEPKPEIVEMPKMPEIVEPVTPPAPATPPTTAKVAEMIPTDLFALAYIPSWYEQLHDLSEMAQNESWKFKREYPNKNLETPILGAYINRVYRRLATLRNSTPPGEDNKSIFIRGQVLCFHTGLYTPLYKGIYALFRPNPRPSLQRWYFDGFYDEISSKLKAVHPLPKPISELAPRPNNYDPHKPIRVNVGHMIETGENLARLPESIRDAWNLPLLLETAVELSRRKTCIEPGLVSRTRAPQSDAYALPLWLTNMDTPDAAVLLEDMGDYYAARTNLTLEQAYLDARQNGRPTAKWLTDLVE